MAARKTEAPRNDDLSHEEQMAFATMASLADIDLKKLAIKLAIGYAFLVSSAIAAEYAAVSLALLVSNAWLQLVIFFFVLAAAFVGLVYVTPLVTNAVYDAGAWMGNKLYKFAMGAKDKAYAVVERVKPAATVH